MPNDELLADTNRLLQRLLEIDQEQRADSERMRKEFDEHQEKWKTKREDAMKSRLEEQGLSAGALEGLDEDWEKRLNEVRRKNEENLEMMRQKDEQYKEQLLQELRVQSDLLRQIAEKVER